MRARSNGPRTVAGKDRSRFNALKHGMRASTPVLPGEDPDALHARLDAWTASLQPRDDLERYLVERAVQRLLAARPRRPRLGRPPRRDLIAPPAADAAAAEADEVLVLGRRLFWDPRGPLGLYPQFEVTIATPCASPGPPTSRTPTSPPALVNRLEGTAAGLRLAARPLGRAARAAGGRPEVAAARPVQGDPAAGPAAAGRRSEDERVLAVYLCCEAMDPGSRTRPRRGQRAAQRRAERFNERNDGAGRCSSGRRRPRRRAGRSCWRWWSGRRSGWRLLLSDTWSGRRRRVRIGWASTTAEEGERLRRYQWVQPDVDADPGCVLEVLPRDGAGGVRRGRSCGREEPPRPDGGRALRAGGTADRTSRPDRGDLRRRRGPSPRIDAPSPATPPAAPADPPAVAPVPPAEPAPLAVRLPTSPL